MSSEYLPEMKNTPSEGIRPGTIDTMNGLQFLSYVTNSSRRKKIRLMKKFVGEANGRKGFSLSFRRGAKGREKKIDIYSRYESVPSESREWIRPTEDADRAKFAGINTRLRKLQWQYTHKVLLERRKRLRQWIRKYHSFVCLRSIYDTFFLNGWQNSRSSLSKNVCERLGENWIKYRVVYNYRCT